MSGKINEDEKLVIQNVTKNLLGETQLIHWEDTNLECEKKRGYLMQICWLGLNFKVIYQKKAMLRNSVARIIELNKNEKAFITKASL